MHAADISVNYGSKLRFKWLSSSKQHESSLDPLVRVIDSESWINLVPSQSQTGVQLSLCSYRPIQYTHHLGMIYHGNFLSRFTEMRFVIIGHAEFAALVFLVKIFCIVINNFSYYRIYYNLIGQIGYFSSWH